MGSNESLSLPYRLESSHTSLFDPGHLKALLDAIVLILLRAVDRVRNQFPVRDSITAQFISHDLPGFTAVTAQ